MKTKQLNPPSRTRRSLFLPIFIVLIFVMSIFGFVIGTLTPDSPSDLNVMRGGYSFTPTSDGGWTVSLGGITLTLRTSPNDLLFSELDVPLTSLHAAQKVYLTHPPSTSVSTLSSFYSHLRAVKTVSPACMMDGPGCENLPLKTCADAHDTTVVVNFIEDSVNDISFDTSCYTLRGDSLYLTQMADTLLLAYYGVTA